MRYDFFNEVCRETNTNVLFTAHNQNDQVETILLRIIKGSSYSGLTGIPEERLQNNGPTIYRPLLGCLRSEIEEYAKENDLSPRIDSSNFNMDYLRNRIRHELIPLLKNYNNNVEQALLRLSVISGQNEKIISDFMHSFYDNIFEDNFTINTSKFFILPEHIKPKIIIKLFENNNIEYDFKTVEKILSNIENTKLTIAGKKYSLQKNLFLNITQKNIKIISFEPNTMIQSTQKVAIPGITELKELNIKLKITEYKDNNNDNISYPPSYSDKVLVDLSQIKTELILRTRRPGDIINPLGMKGSMKLKKYLINNHVSQQKKDLLPLIATGNEVLWLAGMVLSNKIKVVKQPTHMFEIMRG